MEKIVGTPEFLAIINRYKYENFLQNKLLIKTLTDSKEENVRQVLVERNENLNKHPMEEDESEKLTNFKLNNSNNPQKLKSVMMNIPDVKKKKLDRKELLRILTNSDEEDEDDNNKFETSSKNTSKNVHYNNIFLQNKNKNKLETIYEKDKNDNDKFNDLETKIYKNDDKIFINAYDRKNSLNTPPVDMIENEEININNITPNNLKYKKQRAQSHNTNFESLITSCDSRIVSAFKSDKDSYISIVSSPDIGSGLFKII